MSERNLEGLTAPPGRASTRSTGLGLRGDQGPDGPPDLLEADELRRKLKVKNGNMRPNGEQRSFTGPWPRWCLVLVLCARVPSGGTSVPPDCRTPPSVCGSGAAPRGLAEASFSDSSRHCAAVCQLTEEGRACSPDGRSA